MQDPTIATVEDIDPGWKPGSIATASPVVALAGSTSAQRRLRPWHGDPRLVLALVSIVAIMSAALTGRIDQAPVASAAPDAGSGAAAGSMAPSPASGAVIVLTAPGTDQVVRGAAVNVRGAAGRDLGLVRFRVLFGDLELGEADTSVFAGPVSVSIPVFSPVVPLPVRLVLDREETAQGEAPLLDRPFRLGQDDPVGVWSLGASRLDGPCEVAARGPAPLTVGSISASIAVPGSTLARKVAQIVPAAALGAALFGQGTWSVALRLPESSGSRLLAAGGARLELAWADPVDRTAGSVSIPVGDCLAPSPTALPARHAGRAG